MVDVNTSLHASTATYISNSNGICQTNNSFNVAGSFTIDPGAVTGISLTGLMLKNGCTALEGLDIPNAALNFFYEPAATGMEIFGDGNEVFACALAGDWDGNTGDNIFGSTTFNIPLNGKIRVYVLLCAYNSPAAVGKLINLGITNDGIFLSPALDGFTKLRINAGSISQRNIVLPIQFIRFSGNRSNDLVQLEWAVNFTDEPKRFLIQQSYDGVHFTDAGIKPLTGFTQQTGRYQSAINTAAEYFRLAGVYSSGLKNFSNIIRIKNDFREGLKLLQNPVRDKIIFESSLIAPANFSTRLFDITGKLLSAQNTFANTGLNKISIPSNSTAQFLLLRLQSMEGVVHNFKIIKQ